MKTKIWVLTSEAEDDVCVYDSEGEALETFEVAMIVEWQSHAPSSEKDNFPDGDPWQAHAVMADAVEGWPKWRIIPVEVDVPVPEAFRDLLTLAQWLDEFREDYRMNAVVRACEAAVAGAEASPAPGQPAVEGRANG